MKEQLWNADLNNASPAYAAVMRSHRFECFTSLAKPTMLVYSKNGDDNY